MEQPPKESVLALLRRAQDRTVKLVEMPEDDDGDVCVIGTLQLRPDDASIVVRTTFTSNIPVDLARNQPAEQHSNNLAVLALGRLGAATVMVQISDANRTKMADTEPRNRTTQSSSSSSSNVQLRVVWMCFMGNNNEVFRKTLYVLRTRHEVSMRCQFF
jgi:hypothetical protein